jgi:hypothetical protein
MQERLHCYRAIRKIEIFEDKKGEWTYETPASRTKRETCGSSVRRLAMTFPAVPAVMWFTLVNQRAH